MILIKTSVIFGLIRHQYLVFSPKKKESYTHTKTTFEASTTVFIVWNEFTDAVQMFHVTL